ncbi:MAG: carboxypeptidase regulatory-like domain-containing protein [Candidatus Methanoperedens sp.]|nr:carboxypeptidase regulatory-like domain-containing protein [Candidatus Methanoperedens sp.]
MNKMLESNKPNINWNINLGNLLLILIILFSFSIQTAIAQDISNSMEWNKTFKGKYWEEGYSAQQTSDGGYFLSGTTWLLNDSSAWIIKTDENGNEQWNFSINGYNFDMGAIAQQTSGGDYIYGGHTESYGAGESDGWLIKVGSNGNELWNKTYGGIGFDMAAYVQETKDKGYIMPGFTLSYGNNGDMWIIKTDENGNEQWNKTFGGSSLDIGFGVEQTSDNGYIVTGPTYSYGQMGDVLLVKTDSNGNEMWNKTFGSHCYDESHAVHQTLDGGYILTGGTFSYGNGLSDVWLIKTDSNGNEQWNKTFGGKDYDFSYAVQQTSDGGYVTVGTTYSYGIGGDTWVIKTDSMGNELWNITLGGVKYDESHYIKQTSDGGYILGGLTYSYGAENSDPWLVKIPSMPSQAPHPIPEPGSPPSGSISGYVINDMNRNGVWDTGEPGIPGAAIKLVGMSVMRDAITDAQGFYEFDNLPPGRYVEVSMASGWIPTSSIVKWVIPVEEGINSTNNNFTNVQMTVPSITGSISGYVVNDTNGNGVWDTGENGISGVDIILDISGNSTKRYTSTDVSGYYKFDNLSEGEYSVKEKVPEGMQPTNHTKRKITLTKGDNNMNNNFTNIPAYIHSE